MKKVSILSIMIAAFASMAPGYGRPALEISLDRVVDRYEAALDPETVFASMIRQTSTNDGWQSIENRQYDTVFKRRDRHVIVRTDLNLFWVRESGETGPKFFASYFPKTDMNPVTQGGTLFVRPDGVQINASLFRDGSLVWAVSHPDGRVFKRTERPDGSLEYAVSTH